MARPRYLLHLLIFTESIFLYIAVTRLKAASRLCSSSHQHQHHLPHHNSSLPTIYVVTPTYTRPTQLPDLTRLANTLRLVPNLHWLVCEDAKTITQVVAKYSYCHACHTQNYVVLCTIVHTMGRS